MIPVSDVGSVELADLLSLVAQKAAVTRSMVLPFADHRRFLTDLLRAQYRPGCRLVAAGHVDPDVEIAADRAQIELMENIGPSPFTGHTKTVLEASASPFDIIYAANPNRVTGAGFSLADLGRMAEAVPKGLLIIDEYYYEYFGITGRPLLDNGNVIVLRSLTAPYGVRSIDAGYALASPDTVNRFAEVCTEPALSSTTRHEIFSALKDTEALARRVRGVHDESLRIASELTRLGVQCRLSATDFILMRVADPAQVGNQLARFRVPIDNLDGYPELKKYIRYRVELPPSNERLLEAFAAMPSELYRMKTLDNRALTMRLGSHAVPPAPDDKATTEAETGRRISVPADKAETVPE